jgi:hypothetical protein
MKKEQRVVDGTFKIYFPFAELQIPNPIVLFMSFLDNKNL